jgi:membrane protein YdbS with pleckstrin-like domain
MDRPDPGMSLLDPVQAPPQEAPVHRLHPRTVTLWRLTSGLWWLFWTLSMLVPWAVWEWPLWLMAPVAALGIAWTAYVPAAHYRHFTYQVGEVDVRVMHGWLTRHVSVVLHSRIQHVDTRQGPIERALGLAGVVIYTAGSVGAMVGIPGLAEREAEALRDRLAHLSGTDDAL